MTSATSPTRIVEPDLQRMSEILKDTRPEMIFYALGFKTPTDEAIETAQSWQALCEAVGKESELPDITRRAYWRKQEAFTRAFFASITSLAVLKEARFLAVVSGTTYDASHAGRLRVERALEIINDPALRPQTIDDVNTEKHNWSGAEAVTSRLTRLRDEYIAQAIASGESDLDTLCRMYTLAESKKLEEDILKVMIPLADDLWKAAFVLKKTGNPTIRAVCVDYLRNALAGKDIDDKMRIAAQLHDSRLMNVAFVDIHNAYLSAGDIASAELVEKRISNESDKDGLGSWSSREDARRATYDRLHLSDITSSLPISDLIEISKKAPYGTETRDKADALIRAKIDELIDNARTFGHTEHIRTSYNDRMTPKQHEKLRAVRRPFVDALLKDAKAPENFSVIWEKLDAEERKDMLENFARLLAPLVPKPESKYVIKVPA